MLNIILILVVSLLIILGLIGVIIPALPGVPIVFLGLLIYAFFTNFATVTWGTVLFLFTLTLISVTANYFSGLLVAKKLGATKYGIWGGMAGLLLGLIFSPFGLVSIIIAPLLGTVAGELIGGKKIIESSKIGLGTLVGYLAAIALDLVIAGWMIVVFLRALF